ncbi:phage terminase small subunit [Sphingomonas sp. SORGH_AS_0438]|uniref:phage terminase small subunit n=1 Tax=Sphingomonas sp. SORGH_AS_0438 TaxID=3041756 RepID=UPI002854FE69|nr:phage terminase small subunit [Sphingomonas sp. SORGH_AS_0438]MDR6128033.1 hypothetical protein [Sphingomonas sp. SORGH_AS_0438]
MSLVRKHRDRIAATKLAQQALDTGSMGGFAPQAAIVVAAATTNPAAAQIQLRLTHDLRRLKDIQSIQGKIAAKREMLPEYRAWCDGLLAAARDANAGVAEEVLPTIMVWCIDTGDWPRALELARYVLRYDVPLPGRYVRAAPSLIAEEIATAALKIQTAGEAFPIDVLEEVELLVAGIDMHDEIRAKLMKAIGTEYARGADAATGPEISRQQMAGLAALRKAQDLHDRAGCRQAIQRLEKALAASAALAATSEPATTDTPTDTGATSA